MQKSAIAKRLVLRLPLTIVFFCLTLSSNVFGQVTISGGNFTIKGSNAIFSCQRLYGISGVTLANEGSLYVSDTFALRNGTSVFNNSGSFYAGKAAVFDTATMNHTGDMFISTAFKVRISSTDLATLNSSSGNLTFYQTGNKSLRTHDLQQVDLNKLVMGTTGQNLTTLRSSVNVDSLVLTNGKIVYESSAQDSLTVNQGGVVIGGNVNSYADSLYRIPTGTGTTLYYPVGNTATVSQFRPFEVKDITYDGSVDPHLVVAYKETSLIVFDDSVGLNEVGITNFWRIRDELDTMDNFIARPSFRSGDVASVVNAVVAASNTGANKIFYSLGANNFTQSTDSVSIEGFLQTPNNVIATVGQSTRIKLNLSVFLGGAIIGANGSMESVLNRKIRDTLTARFEAGGIVPRPMIQTYSIPDSAVDRIKIYLRTTTAASSTIDSSYAWLMPDGTIRDFTSGSVDYITFAHAPAGSYYVVVTHRNHLSVMSASTLALTTGIPGGTQIDLGNIVNIYGAGAGDNGSVAFMWEGNANFDREVNAADLFQVEQAYNTHLGQTNLNLGYVIQDVDMTDSNVQISSFDYSRVISGNNWIYFSAVPGI